MGTSYDLIFVLFLDFGAWRMCMFPIRTVITVLMDRIYISQGADFHETLLDPAIFGSSLL